jgi:putative addiction module component (TIGR02574 family)
MSIQEILKLPEADRLAMIDLIWKSIETQNIEVSTNQQKELDRRLKLDQEGKMKWHSLDEVKLKLNKKD